MSISKIRLVLKLLMGAVFLSVLVLTPEQTHAQWPPFSFKLTPSYRDGQITYKIGFSIPKKVDWSMTDIHINIPLPGGTRFIDAGADLPAEVSFDGAEVQFFIPALPKRSLKNAFFIVEVVDPTETIYLAHAWIGWEGDVPGNFLTKNVKFDTSLQSLDWIVSSAPRLELKVNATTDDGVVTYLIYPRNASKRMWDVHISLPIPEGTSLLSVQAPEPFVAGSNEHEVAFSGVELGSQPGQPPLVVRLAAADVAGRAVTTQVWASWKNAGKNVGINIPAEETLGSPDIIVQPWLSQSTVMDRTGDVPFPNYDLTSFALQEVVLPGRQEEALKVTFRAVGELKTKDEPVEYTLFIDNDCQTHTGKKERYLGAEYRILYRHKKGRADFYVWDKESRKWESLQRLPFDAPVNSDRVTVWIPSEALQNNGKMCWLTTARYRSTQFNPLPPTDYLPSSRRRDLRLVQYDFATAITEIETNLPVVRSKETDDKRNVSENETKAEAADNVLITAGMDWQYLPGWSELPKTWKEIDFDDSNWFSGPTTIGYGKEEYATDLSRATPNVFKGDAPILVQYPNPETGTIIAVPPSGQERSLYMRHTFTITDSTLLEDLSLEIRYRDGFVAYLNGVEVARRKLGKVESPVYYYTFAAKQNTARRTTIIDLREHIPDLVEGDNVLAVQVHQASRSYELLVDITLSFLKRDPIIIADQGN